MVGHMLYRYMSSKGHIVFDVSRKKTPTNKTFNYDIKESTKILEIIDRNDFDYVINCAAVLVKQSEESRIEAVYTNAYFPQLLADHCLNLKTKIIQLSTGGVFSGRDSVGFGNEAYYEKSLLSPSNFYGATKAAGEILNNKDITIRTDFWGPDSNENGQGLFNWIMTQNDAVQGYDDVYFNGISNIEFCHFVEWLFENDISGVIHVGAKNHISKGELIRMINDRFNLNLLIKGCRSVKNSIVLKNTFPISYHEKTYDEMCEEIEEYLKKNKGFYPHYFKR